MHVHTMALGAYQTNCYLAWGEDAATCVVIDPGYEPERVLAQAEKLGKGIEAILLTHGHFDHVGGVKAIAQETGCKVYIHKLDMELPQRLTLGTVPYTDNYEEGDVLSLGGLSIRVMHTPGHTPGSVCLLMEDAMFSGDTLFAGSMGRCDFPGSNIFDMRKSLRSLCALEKNYRIFPGHGEDSTLDFEKKTNPYLR